MESTANGNDEEWDWVLSPRADVQFEKLEGETQERIVSKWDEVVSSEWRDPADFLETVTNSSYQKLRVGGYRLGCRLLGTDNVERVYEVATTITEPTRITTITERADCSKGGARTNLEWLAELGVVELESEDPALYRRNEAYFDFLRVDRLVREHEEGELEELIDDYDARERELADQFYVDSPADEDLHSTVEFEELDDAHDRLSDG